MTLLAWCLALSVRLLQEEFGDRHLSSSEQALAVRQIFEPPNPSTSRSTDKDNAQRLLFSAIRAVTLLAIALWKVVYYLLTKGKGEVEKSGQKIPSI